MAGVYLGGMKTTRALENVFFNNPFFGVLRRNNQMFRDIGCDYCFWTIHFRFVVNSPFRVVYRVVFQEPPELPKCKVKGPSNLNKHRQQQGLPLSLISNILKLELISRNEPLTQILFVSSRTVGRSAPGFRFRLHVTCPPSHAFREIIKIKKKMEHKLEKYKMSYSKYSNWPSCDSSDWMTRYWGEIATCLDQTVWFNLFFFRGELSSAAGDQSPVGPRERVQPLPERRKHRQLLLPFYPQQASGSSTSLAFQ